MMDTTKRGILLMNLGSPDSTRIPDVKRYLNEFLMDDRVIDKPWIVRAPLVQGIIVPFRAPKSAEAYKTIWTKDGSPLIVYSRELRDALQKELPYPVEITMRYGNPSPETAFNKLMERMPGLEDVFAIPLYPHYAMSSFETAVEYAKKVHHRKRYPFRLNFLKPFYRERSYIEALADRMKPYLQQPYDHILFSYHGIPERHILKTDPTKHHCFQSANCCDISSPAHAFCYRHQGIMTTRLLVKELRIPEGKYSISYQSRLGKGWLQPFTDVRLEQMPAEGIRKLLVVCPAFVSDCLETLEEIAERGRESFMQAGGEAYQMIPCLNTHPLWVEALARWVNDYAAGNNHMVFDA